MSGVEIICVMGVAGAGKSTVGRLLASELRCEFLDADTLHPRANIEKMSRGIPLDDADRAPWLTAIHARIVESFRNGQSLGSPALPSNNVTGKLWPMASGSPGCI